MTAPADTVLVLRCCRADRVALRGFVWPSQGPVSCDDWSPEPVCGGGLHGWLWGAGDLHASIEAHEYPGAVWLVVEVAADQVVDLGGQVKFPRGSVVYCGDRDVAVEMIRRRAPAGTATMFATVTGGHRATVTGGDDATVTGGDHATVTGGDDATVTGGYRATVTGGHGATLSILYWCPKRERWRRAIAEAGEGGIEPGTAYVLDAANKFVKAGAK